MNNTKTMSKLLALLLCVVMVLTLTACGKPDPKKAAAAKVEELCKAIQSADLKKVAKLTGGDENLEGTDEIPGLQSLVQEVMSSVKYSLGEVVVEEKTANVPVHFTFDDQSEMFAAAFKNYFAKVMELAFTSAFSEDVEEPTEEELTKLLEDCLKDAQATVKEKKTAEKDVTFALKQDDKGDWNFETFPEALADVITGNIISVLTSLNLGL